MDSGVGTSMLLGRYDETTGVTKREWYLNLRNGTNRQPQMVVADESAAASIA